MPPYDPAASGFGVWQALRAIPFGETWSYAQLAARIGNASAMRAVGLGTHIFNNHLKSVLLLAGFPFLLILMLGGFFAGLDMNWFFRPVKFLYVLTQLR